MFTAGNYSVNSESSSLFRHAMFCALLLGITVQLSVLLSIVPCEISRMLLGAMSNSSPKSTFSELRPKKVSSQATDKERKSSWMPLCGLLATIAGSFVWRSKISPNINGEQRLRFRTLKDRVALVEERMKVDTQRSQLLVAQLLVGAELLSADQLAQAHEVSVASRQFLNDCLSGFGWFSKFVLETAMIVHIQVEDGLLGLDEAYAILRDAKRSDDALAAELLLEQTRKGNCSSLVLRVLPSEIHAFLDQLFDDNEDYAAGRSCTTEVISGSMAPEAVSLVGGSVFDEALRKVRSARWESIFKQTGWLQVGGYEQSIPAGATAGSSLNEEMLLQVVERVESKFMKEEMQASDVTISSRASEPHEFLCADRALHLCGAWLLELAQQPDTPAAVLRRLAQTDDTTIRKAAAMNLGAPLDLLWLNEADSPILGCKASGVVGPTDWTAGQLLPEASAALMAGT